jgi:hypothetical protein
MMMELPAFLGQGMVLIPSQADSRKTLVVTIQ